MIRDVIQGYDRTYTIEELASIPQNSKPFGIPVCEGSDRFIHECLDDALLDDEEFKERKVAGLSLQVSNLGRVKLNGKILRQIDDIASHPNGGYLFLDCPEYPEIHRNGKFYVYKLVADAWLAYPDVPEEIHRHHINNNGYDNRAANLIFLTKEEHGRIHSPLRGVE